MSNEERTILKLYEIVKLGYVPSRGLQHYSKSTARLVNCFEHAFYGLTNTQIKTAGLDLEDKETFGNIFSKKPMQDDIQKMFYFVRETGLKIEECDYSAVVKMPEVKVALYFQKNLFREDFHFYREEKSRFGKTFWTGKVGFSSIVQKERDLDMHMNGYSYHGCYKISNPNIDK